MSLKECLVCVATLIELPWGCPWCTQSCTSVPSFRLGLADCSRSTGSNRGTSRIGSPWTAWSESCGIKITKWSKSIQWSPSGQHCKALQQGSLTYSCWGSWTLQGIWGKSQRRGNAPFDQKSTKDQARRSLWGQLLQRPERIIFWKSLSISYFWPEVNHGAAVHIGLGEKAGARTKIHQVGFVSVRLRKKIKDWKRKTSWTGKWKWILKEPSKRHRSWAACSGRSTLWTSLSKHSSEASWTANSPGSPRWWNTGSQCFNLFKLCFVHLDGDDVGDDVVHLDGDDVGDYVVHLDSDDVGLDALDEGKGRGGHCKAVLKLRGNLEMFPVISLRQQI